MPLESDVTAPAKKLHNPMLWLLRPARLRGGKADRHRGRLCQGKPCLLCSADQRLDRCLETVTSAGIAEGSARSRNTRRSPPLMLRTMPCNSKVAASGASSAAIGLAGTHQGAPIGVAA